MSDYISLRVGAVPDKPGKETVLTSKSHRVAILTATPLLLTGLLLAAGSTGRTAPLLQKSKTTKKPTGQKAPAQAAKPSAAIIAAGKAIYDKNGCATCHAIGGKGGNAGPDLSHTGSVPAHTQAWFAVQITNPKAHTPGSTMPAFAQIKGSDLTSLSAYMVSLKEAGASSAVPSTPTKVAGPPPNPAIVAKIEKLGGRVDALAQSDARLDVSFHRLGAAVTDASLSVLAGLKNVAHLDLGQTVITDAGLAHIKGLTSLTELHLEETKITDAGLASLKDMRDLEYLNLFGTNVTDAGLNHLAGLKNLKHLYVWQTKVTPAGADKLKAALPKLEVVLGLDAPAGK